MINNGTMYSKMKLIISNSSELYAFLLNIQIISVSFPIVFVTVLTNKNFGAEYKADVSQTKPITI